MSDKRTKKQVDANNIDLEIFNLARMLERFALNNGERNMSAKLVGLRLEIRKHMHKHDREQTK